MFQDYLTRWSLTPDGEPIITSTSRLLPVVYQDAPAMLKIAVVPEEKRGGAVMRWWGGCGAAALLAMEGDAVLLERATGRKSLAEMARTDSGDLEACQIICGVVTALNGPRRALAPPGTPLAEWFRELFPVAEAHGGIWSLSARAARELLAHPQGNQLLHGDIHHENILDFGERGWLAIDPKGLSGERGFDYANLFCNPSHAIATAPGRVARRADSVSAAAKLDRRRLLLWVLAWAGLSAAWRLDEGQAPDGTLAVAGQAAAELGL